MIYSQYMMQIITKYTTAIPSKTATVRIITSTTGGQSAFHPNVFVKVLKWIYSVGYRSNI